MPPAGFEPTFQPPQGRVISIELWGQTNQLNYLCHCLPVDSVGGFKNIDIYLYNISMFFTIFYLWTIGYNKTNNLILCIIQKNL